DDLGVACLSQVIDLSHSHGYWRIRKCKRSTLFLRLECGLPRNRIFIKGTEDDAAFSSQKVIRHKYFCHLVSGAIIRNYGEYSPGRAHFTFLPLDFFRRWPEILHHPPEKTGRRHL